MKIVHISDTHNSKHHIKLQIPECDILIHTGDIGGRTGLTELGEFLIWFEKQPAKKKIFIGGNHDLILDKNFASDQKKYNNIDTVFEMILRQQNRDALELIQNYDVKYLCNQEYIFEGIKIWGSPYSPSFHKEYWCFNADRGKQISSIWSKIPSDVNILLTHTPMYEILDSVDEKYRRTPDEDMNVGCKDLFDIAKKRLLKLNLHLSGHIHDNYGIVLKSISNTRHIMFSNGAILNNDYKQLITKPLIIDYENLSSYR